MPTQIAFFNHKGGVAKTTSVFNVGWMLASKNYNVMIVDCDPQCNLTGLILEYDHDELYPFESKDKSRPLNIRDSLSPVFEGRPIPMRPTILKKAPYCDNLFLLPGHVGLAEYESTLAIAHNLSDSLSALQNIPGSLRQLIDLTAKENGIDYVLIDMSPSLGAINQNILMTSDSFIIPMAPDFFSGMALRSLSKTLPNWKKWSKSLSENPILLEADYPWPKKNPKYFGSIVQNFRRRQRGGGEIRPTRAYQKWFDELSRVKEETLLPSLENEDFLLINITEQERIMYYSDFLMEVSDFNSLVAVSQEKSKPVFTLTAQDTDTTGVVWTQNEGNIAMFREIYSEGADKIIKLSEKLYA